MMPEDSQFPTSVVFPSVDPRGSTVERSVSATRVAWATISTGFVERRSPVTSKRQMEVSKPAAPKLPTWLDWSS